MFLFSEYKLAGNRYATQSLSVITITLGSHNKSPSLNGRAIKALPSPLRLNGRRNFFLFSRKTAGNGFWQFFFLPQIFGLKYLYFLENIVTTQIKYLLTNFNVTCPYFDNFFKVKWFLSFKTNLQLGRF